jgi:hypothetical protein
MKPKKQNPENFDDGITRVYSQNIPEEIISVTGTPQKKFVYPDLHQTPRP